ncbi:hypothetical protein Leryth_025641 [Lithospermum erythrorhizon]|nr:hypothetical protein Leryth_025641 [Lithospermum erythrorhizon]
MGAKYNLDSIRAGLDNKKIFYCLSSNLQISPSSSDKSPRSNFPISPFKRQMDNATLRTADATSPTKRKLTFDDNTKVADLEVPGASFPFSVNTVST